MESSLKKRYIIKLFSNIVSGVIGAILVAIVPKALGPVSYGYFVYLQDFFMKLIGFLDMGTSTAFFTKLSSNNSRKELIIFYFLYSFIIVVLILIFLFFIKKFNYTDEILPDIPNSYIYMGFFYAFIAWFSQIFIKISDAYALTVSVEIIKILHKIISLLLLLYIIYLTNFDLISYFYFQYITFIMLLLILGWLFIKKNIFKNITISIFNFKLMVKEFIEYCHPLFVYSIVGIIIGLFDIWLLQKVSGSIQTGFYGLAYSFAAMCFLFTSAMTPIITREFSKSFAEKDIEKMRKLFYRYIPMLYSIAAYFGIFISMQSENILEIFTDEKFKDAYLVLMIMAFYPIHQTYGQLSGSIFYATGQTKLYRNIGIISMLIGVLLSFIFIYIFNLGAIGLAYKMIFSQLIGVNIQLYFNSRFLNFDIKYFIFHQVFSVVFFIIVAYFSINIFSMDKPVLEFFLSGIIYTVLVIISGYMFPQIFAITKNEKKLVINKIKSYIGSVYENKSS